MADFNANQNNFNKLSQFDKMKYTTEQQKTSPTMTVPVFEGDTTAQIKNRKDKKEKQESKQFFRPTTQNLKSDRFIADNLAVAPKKKIAKRKLFLVCSVPCVILVLILSCVFIKPLNTRVSLVLGGTTKYYTKYTKAVSVTENNKITNKLDWFKLFIADNSFKGGAKLELTPDYANKIGLPELTGKYNMTYALETSENESVLNLSVEDFTKPIVIKNNWGEGTLVLKPYFADTGIAIKNSDFKDLTNAINLGDLDFLSGSEDFSGVNLQALAEALTDKEKINKELDLYKIDLLLSSKPKINVNLKSTEMPYGGTANSTMVLSWDWQTFRDLVANYVQSAKTDSDLLKIANSAGLTEQAYMNHLSEVLAFVDTAFHSANRNDTVTLTLYLNAKNEYIAKVLHMPSSSAEDIDITYSPFNSEGKLSLIGIQGVQTLFAFSVQIDKRDEAGLSGSFDFETNNKTFSGIFTNLYMSNSFINGELKVKTNKREYNIALKDLGGTQSVILNCSESGVLLYTLEFDIKLYTVTSIQEVQTEVDLKNNSDKISDYVNSLDLTELTNFYKQSLTAVNEESLRYNIIEILTCISNKNYDWKLKDIEVKATTIDSDLAIANNNAKIIATSLDSLIQECLKTEKAEVPNGVYCGQLTSESGNIAYDAVFEKQSIEECLGCSIDSGYYCAIVQNNKVTYAFWSKYVNLPQNVANKTLATHYENITSYDTVIGSYPIESKRGY